MHECTHQQTGFLPRICLGPPEHTRCVFGCLTDPLTLQTTYVNAKCDVGVGGGGGWEGIRSSSVDFVNKQHEMKRGANNLKFESKLFMHKFIRRAPFEIRLGITMFLPAVAFLPFQVLVGSSQILIAPFLFLKYCLAATAVGHHAATMKDTVCIF